MAFQEGFEPPTESLEGFFLRLKSFIILPLVIILINYKNFFIILFIDNLYSSSDIIPFL